MNIIDLIQNRWPCITNIKNLKSGGQKDVFSANSTKWGDVAIKIYKTYNARANREIDIIKRYNISQTPNILDSYVFSVNGRDVMVLIEEFIHGGSLQDKVSNNIKYSIDEVIPLMDFLLSTVVFLESIHIIHRDIKPDNIICTEGGSYKLIDFGIARDLNQVSLTATSDHSPFTPGYAAPELMHNNAKATITNKVDLFSIGVVAYVMITGINPYIKENDNFFDVCLRTATMPTPMLAITSENDKNLFDYIRSLMSKEAYKRPLNADTAYNWFKKIRTDRERRIAEEQIEEIEKNKMGDYLE